MNSLKIDRKKLTIEKLEKKGATEKSCSRCGSHKLTLVGECIIVLQNNPNAFAIGGQGIPVTMVACSDCGNIWQHALGALGMER